MGKSDARLAQETRKGCSSRASPWKAWAQMPEAKVTGQCAAMDAMRRLRGSSPKLESLPPTQDHVRANRKPASFKPQILPETSAQNPSPFQAAQVGRPFSTTGFMFRVPGRNVGFRICHKILWKNWCARKKCARARKGGRKAPIGTRISINPHLNLKPLNPSHHPDLRHKNIENKNVNENSADPFDESLTKNGEGKI